MKRQKHTLSNYHLLTANMGQLIPVGFQEALPGDTFQINSSALIRVSPLAAPVMHPVTARIHHFFVPHRLVWPEWEDFITGGPDGMNADSPPTMTVPAQGGPKTLLDYLGIPTNAAGCQVSALPIYGINRIFNEYYRDQDLAPERALTDTSLPNIAWGRDYFTTARPWTQKGPDITLPLTGGKIPVMGIMTDMTGVYSSSNVSYKRSDGTSQTYGTSTGTKWAAAAASPWMFWEENPDHPGYPNAHVDLGSASQISVNDFRRGFALQRYQEARARYGSRYTEYLRYLGVTPSDARLQLPEFLGGGSTRLNFSEVLQTAEVTAGPDRETYGVGDMYGHGIAGMRSNRVRRFIEEHGYLFTFLSVRPKAIYMNGIHRTFLKATKEDFWQKELEHIGQQEIWQNEIYAQAGQTEADVFGYQDRYREYRETPSIVCGEYRDVLDYWHMARSLPPTTALNEDFVKCVPTTRIHNVQTNDTLWCMVNNHVVARRAVSKSAYARIL